MSNPASDPKKRYQCRHIFTSGHRCGSPSLRGENFCYYHHATRRPAPRHMGTHPDDTVFVLPPLEDRAAIQLALSEVLARIAYNQLDLKRGRTLLLGLRAASANLGREPRPTPPPSRARHGDPAPAPPETNDLVEEVELDPTDGPIALVAELPPIAELPHAAAPPPAAAEPSRVKGTAEKLWDEVSSWHFPAGPDCYPNGELKDPYAFDPAPATLPKIQACAEPTILPTIQAVADPGVPSSTRPGAPSFAAPSQRMGYPATLDRPRPNILPKLHAVTEPVPMSRF